MDVAPEYLVAPVHGSPWLVGSAGDGEAVAARYREAPFMRREDGSRQISDSLTSEGIHEVLSAVATRSLRRLVTRRTYDTVSTPLVS